MSVKPQRKLSPHRQEVENRILRAAETCFAQQGFAGTTMDKVAALAGMSKQNLIYYFASKEVLYRQVLEHILDLWLETMSFNPKDVSDPETVIRHYITGKLALSRQYPDASKVFAHEVMNGAPVIESTLTSRLKPLFEKDTALVQSWIDQGLMAQIPPQHLFFIIWAATQTYADFSTQICLMLGQEKLQISDFDAAADLLTRMVLQGLQINCTYSVNK